MTSNRARSRVTQERYDLACRGRFENPNLQGPLDPKATISENQFEG
jgi:hypothetical protein